MITNDSLIVKNAVSDLGNAVNDLLATDSRSVNWDAKPGPDKWSKKEIIGHLIDSAQINLQRFIRCTYEEKFKLVYEQVEWVDVNHYQEADLGDLLSLWQLLNRQIIRVLQNYPPNRLQIECDSSKQAVGLHSVEWLAQDYVVHLKHHLNQVYQH
jgi:DinB superfamily